MQAYLCKQVIKREAALGVALRTLHKAGVEGVMVDVWWGIVEHQPGQYDFSAYRRLLQKIADSGLKVQVLPLCGHCICNSAIGAPMARRGCVIPNPEQHSAYQRRLMHLQCAVLRRR